MHSIHFSRKNRPFEEKITHLKKKMAYLKKKTVPFREKIAFLEKNSLLEEQMVFLWQNGFLKKTNWPFYFQTCLDFYSSMAQIYLILPSFAPIFLARPCLISC